MYLTTYDRTTFRYLANIVDPATTSVISVPLPAHTYPGTPVFGPDSGKVNLQTSGDYTTGYQQTLWQIDSDTGAVNHIDWPSTPQSLTFSPDGSHAYATFISNSTCDDSNCRLAVIDTATLATTEIPIPAISRALVVSPDSRYIYATASDNTLMVVDTATNTATAIPLGAEVSGYLLAVTADGKTAYTITGSGYYDYQYHDHFLAVVDLTTQTVAAIAVGQPTRRTGHQPR